MPESHCSLASTLAGVPVDRCIKCGRAYTANSVPCWVFSFTGIVVGTIHASCRTRQFREALRSTWCPTIREARWWWWRNHIRFPRHRGPYSEPEWNASFLDIDDTDQNASMMRDWEARGLDVKAIQAARVDLLAEFEQWYAGSDDVAQLATAQREHGAVLS